MNRPRNRGGYSRNSRDSPSNYRPRQLNHDHDQDNQDGSSRVPTARNDLSSPIDGSPLQEQTSTDNAISDCSEHVEGSVGIEKLQNTGRHQSSLDSTELPRNSPRPSYVSPQHHHNDHVSVPNYSTHQKDGPSKCYSVAKGHSHRSPLQSKASSEQTVTNSSKYIKGSVGIEQPSNTERRQHSEKSTECTASFKFSEHSKSPMIDSPSQKNKQPSIAVNSKWEPTKIKMNKESSEHPSSSHLASSNFSHDQSSLPVHAGRKDIFSQTGGPQQGPRLQESEGSAGSEASKASHAATKYDICPHRSVSHGGPVKLKPSILEKNRERRKDLSRQGGPELFLLRPGMVLLKNYISLSDQLKIIKVCRNLGLGEGGFYHPEFSDGGKMHLKMMCLGKNWDPETNLYEDRRPIDGEMPPTIPNDFKALVNGAIQSSHAFIKEEMKTGNPGDILPGMQPDVCIINFYTKSGKLGLHQDKDESKESLKKGLPVVSFSIGDSADFEYADKSREEAKPEKVRLDSGDVLIFGGKARHIFHGVSSIIPDSAPRSLVDDANLRAGRLNLTFRQY